MNDGVWSQEDLVVLIELCNERLFTVPVASVWSVVYTSKSYRGLGPLIQALRVHALGLQRGAYFQFRVVGQSTYDGEEWRDFANPIFTSTTAGNDNQIGSEYTARDDFGLLLRFRIEVYSTMAADTGILSITVAAEYLR